MSPKFFVLGAALLAAPSCFGSLITFDDIFVPPEYDSWVPIENGYQTFNWNNFGAFYGPGSPLSGYAAGVVSIPNVAFNLSGAAASFSSPTAFSFTSAYFTAAWMDGLNITVAGLNGSTILDSTTIVVSATTPALVTFDWTGLTQVDFSAFGGTLHQGYSGGPGSEFALDNLTINGTPEPGTALLAGMSGLVLWCGLLARSRRFSRR
jgi:hypothetical protein